MSPAWIGVTVGVLGLILGFTYFWLGRKPKVITYEVTTDQALMGDVRGFRELAVQYGAQSVENPRVVTMRFANVGKVELRREDYYEDLGVRLEGDARVVSAYLVLEPTDGSPGVELDPSGMAGDRVTAPASLLNEGDTLELRLLVDGKPTSIVRAGRLAGFKLRYSAARASADDGASTAQLIRTGTVSALAMLAVMSLFLWFSIGRLTDVVFENNGYRSVPEVVGLSTVSAQQRLYEEGFDLVMVGTDAGPVEVSSVPNLKVSRVAPSAGTRIRETATVMIYVQ